VDIWIYVHQKEGELEAATLGLITEAQRLLTEMGREGRVTAVALGPAAPATLETLGHHGVQQVLHVGGDGDELAHYQGELYTEALVGCLGHGAPACLLMAQTAETEDLAPRLAAQLEVALVTRVMDLHLDVDGSARAIRPVANGYLFEELEVSGDPPLVVVFLPSVLQERDPISVAAAPVSAVPLAVDGQALQTRTVDVIAAAPETLDLEEADIIVAGGRGMGKGPEFDLIHGLAKCIGGSVGGTRPIIDWGLLPYERQIGQTGKDVTPRLIINCGISGANEYTAGMEKAQVVIAIDRNPRVRMFRFADLGVVGDVHEILPRLISRMEDQK
jgi:electron transfer flavoprotein alpha subunit